MNTLEQTTQSVAEEILHASNLLNDRVNALVVCIEQKLMSITQVTEQPTVCVDPKIREYPPLFESLRNNHIELNRSFDTIDSIIERVAL